MVVRGSFCTNDRTKRSEPVDSKMILYEKSYNSVRRGYSPVMTNRPQPEVGAVCCCLAGVQLYRLWEWFRLLFQA